MPAKKRATPPPIDRPLSKAYLRGFKGWSTAYPPGMSDPASVRVMENMLVERNGALRVRPGLRYLSYEVGPDMNAAVANEPGSAWTLNAIGSQELFYLNDGNRAILYAVREATGAVGFRVLLFHHAGQAVYQLTDPEVGFKIPQGLDQLEFGEETTYVRYLQINNRILALPDSGEAARLFYVGSEKWAKKLTAITVPAWEDAHKPTVVHPEAAWITAKESGVYYNKLPNPAFAAGTKYWSCSDTGKMAVTTYYGATTTQYLGVESLPARRNYATSPLTDLATRGPEGWAPHLTWPSLDPIVEDGALKIEAPMTPEKFFASGARYPGIEPGKKYVIAVDVVDASVNPVMLVDFQAVDGVTVDTVMRVPLDRTMGRYVSAPIQAPSSAVSMKLSFGGDDGNGTWLKLKDLMVVPDGESTAVFDGDSGANYFWEGGTNASSSVYHPAASVEVRSARVPIKPGYYLGSSLFAACSTPTSVTLKMEKYTKDGAFNGEKAAAHTVGAGSIISVSTWVGPGGGADVAEPTSVLGEFVVTATLARGVQLELGSAIFQSFLGVAQAYFDGATRDTDTVRHSWADPLRPHESTSVKAVYAVAPPALTAETPAPDTLISSDEAKNTFKMGFFYTFENEVGESTPSKITEVRIQRAWSDWKWEEPKADGSPDPASPTKTAERCADQLVVQIPQAVYDQAINEGAVAWNLYAMSWSESEAVPVTGLLVGSRPLRTPLEMSTDTSLPYADGSWLAVTPARKVADSELGLPSRTNRVNYSEPPRHRGGLVAGDRMILVGDPTDLASIQWSSNRAAESTNFSASKGGGRKTLTSGNLNIPADVVMWQNPQSVDTITVLCMGDDGRSVAYYMSPSTVNQGQSGVVSGMGFEQVSGTPGTSSPYGALVANNALFRPLDHGLLKTTANNYNISHKTQSDVISNMWQQLRGKQSIVAAQLDNRLYLLVHNPLGELLRADCKGNEIWVFDLAAETGTWSRYLIQANSVNVFSVRNRARLVIGTDDGLLYLDEDALVDDYIPAGNVYIGRRAIPWYFETNTQGASRAHDAWAHLQGLLVTLGNFGGTLKYGVRGKTVNGTEHQVEKEFEWYRREDTLFPEWNVEDHLLVRRDFKEWIFYGSSVGDTPSWGEISSVQYRYTPVSVNVGYEHGSVETFEYGSRVRDVNVENGVTHPFADRSGPAQSLTVTPPSYT